MAATFAYMTLWPAWHHIVMEVFHVLPEAHVAAVGRPVAASVYIPIPTLPHTLAGCCMHHGSPLSLQSEDVFLLCANLQLPISSFIALCLLLRELHAAFLACQAITAPARQRLQTLDLETKAAYHCNICPSSALLEKTYVMAGPGFP